MYSPHKTVGHSIYHHTSMLSPAANDSNFAIPSQMHGHQKYFQFSSVEKYLGWQAVTGQVRRKIFL